MGLKIAKEKKNKRTIIFLLLIQLSHWKYTKNDQDLFLKVY